MANCPADATGTKRDSGCRSSCLETDGWLPRVLVLYRKFPFGPATVAVAHQRAVSPLFHPTNEGFIEFPAVIHSLIPSFVGGFLGALRIHYFHRVGPGSFIRGRASNSVACACLAGSSRKEYEMGSVGNRARESGELKTALVPNGKRAMRRSLWNGTVCVPCAAPAAVPHRGNLTGDHPDRRFQVLTPKYRP